MPEWVGVGSGPVAVAETPVVVLAGGRGTRIAPVTRDLLPKALLPVAGRPFLDHVLDWLEDEGVRTAVLAVGFLGEQVRAHCGTRWGRMHLRYSDEGEQRLGTGGALRRALTLVPELPRSFAVNGDTWFPVDLAELLSRHVLSGAAVTVALARQADRSRYGAVGVAPDGRVVAFDEKAESGPGWINGGVYCVERAALDALPDAAFSLEREVLFPMAKAGTVFALTAEVPFCDIGQPESYRAFSLEKR
jgi:NDP-sugar pyrophosphorylase family protein